MVTRFSFDSCDRKMLDRFYRFVSVDEEYLEIQKKDERSRLIFHDIMSYHLIIVLIILPFNFVLSF